MKALEEVSSEAVTDGKVMVAVDGTDRAAGVLLLFLSLKLNFT